MVTYIRSDLDFILRQIKIAEQHAAGTPLFGPGGLIPSYNIAWGLRTVDGSYNHLLPGQEYWGAADQPFPTHVDPDYRVVLVDHDHDPETAMVPVAYDPTVDNDGPGPSGAGDVIDPYVRLISNLIVDQTLDNPAVIIEALNRNGFEGDAIAAAAEIKDAYQPLKPLFKAVDDATDAYADAQAAADAAVPPDPVLDAAAAAALAALQAAETALSDARALDPDGDGPGLSFDALLAAYGVELSGANVEIPNVAPDEGLSAPFNSWFTLFGQFFDHGLDLVAKGGSGEVFIPLSPDDPLWSDEPGALNFMVLTRATLDENGQAINLTTPYVDQNQTYSSHPSHQVFLRQYTAGPDGPEATGNLITGQNGGMATWGDLKEQAATILGIALQDVPDVGNLPLLRTDPYGNFIPGENGYPQIVVGLGDDGIPNTADDVTVEGNPDDPVVPAEVGALRTGHAFLDDIAHNAVPDGLADGDTEVGGNIPADNEYDDELLDAHYVAGDGRANENIGLTAVHHIFHAEHNRLVQHTKDVAIADAQQMLADGATQAEAVAFLNEWLDVAVTTVPVTAEEIAGLDWNGERVFQAAKFGTEMQYQHLVFEEFARKIQPAINTFLVPDGFDTTMDPTIMAEFAHVVYRFGHSMLTESIDRYTDEFAPDHISLIEGFLNPLQFDPLNPDVAAGDIIRGMTRQVGNHIDEFVTSALRNNLLGLPLDLATINLARGRDTGVPTLNEARREFYEATNNDAQLKPYESWIDFAGNLKNEASIINFIAAYGTHELIAGQTTIEGRRDAALTIILGESVGGFLVPEDAEDFLNGTGAYADGLGGLEDVDLWIGGLAEKTMPFGGMLGSTFTFVFEVQMEALQSGDRFYYLQRLDGLHLFGEMENNSFAAMIMRNTDATHLPSDVFSTPGLILEVNQARQFNDLDGDGTLESNDPSGGGILTPLVVRSGNDLRYNGDEHVVIGGTDDDNRLTAGIGDDTLFGDGGDDRLEGGFGNDIINGGDGDDIITDIGGEENIKAGDGNDVVHAGPGLDLVLAGRGQDFVVLGTDEGSEVFAGEGDDFILGNKNAERILGNEGNDWIETGTFDGAPGDNFDEIFAHDEIDGHDVFLGDGGFDEFIGEGGDDIMVGSPGRGKMAGMSGFDWATYKDSTTGVNADLSFPIVFDESPTLPEHAALDEFESIEGLSGSQFDDILKGSNETAATRLPTAQGGTEGYRGSALDAEGIALIDGLQELLGDGVTEFSGDIILGGDGNDTIQGNAGDDLIDGDKWLDVQIGVFAPDDTDHSGEPLELHDSMRTLMARMVSGELNPGQLSIVRTIRQPDGTGDVDTAVFLGNVADYSITYADDGAVMVTDLVGEEGTDRIYNVEQLQFADALVGVEPGVTFVGTALADVFDGTAVGDTASGRGGADILNGLGGHDTLNGEGGNDVLNGGVGEDTMTGGGGVDRLDGGTGADVMAGGTGNDTYVVDDELDTVNELADQGTDTVETTLNSYTLGDNLENLRFIGAGDFTGTGNAAINRLWGGNDNDILDGGAGADLMTGGLGNDTYVVDDEFDRVVELADGGTDTVLSSVTEVLNGTAANVENLTLTGAANTNGTGNALANALTGNDGDNVLLGGGGDDTTTGGIGADSLTGGAGNDALSGGDGNDVLIGSSGDDVYNGGEGDDVMGGGGGNDLFVFDANFGNDLITGFDANPIGGQDLLDLTGLGISGATFGASVTIEQSGANTLVTIGGNTITLVGVSQATITEDDFLLA